MTESQFVFAVMFAAVVGGTALTALVSEIVRKWGR
jgi:preprotein translocase subunit SecY